MFSLQSKFIVDFELKKKQTSFAIYLCSVPFGAFKRPSCPAIVGLSGASGAWEAWAFFLALNRLNWKITFNYFHLDKLSLLGRRFRFSEILRLERNNHVDVCVHFDKFLSLLSLRDAQFRSSVRHFIVKVNARFSFRSSIDDLIDSVMPQDPDCRAGL